MTNLPEPIDLWTDGYDRPSHKKYTEEVVEELVEKFNQVLAYLQAQENKS